MQVSYEDSRIGNQSFTEIPYVEVPLNKSTCARNYTHYPLVTACDIMPHLSSPVCTCQVEQPNRTNATCQITELNAVMNIILYSCYQPPNIGLVLRDSRGGIILSLRRPTSKSVTVTDPRDGSQLFLEVVQHSLHLTVGVQVQKVLTNVNATLSNHFITQVSSVATNETYIQYTELPVNRSTCPNIGKMIVHDRGHIDP